MKSIILTILLIFATLELSGQCDSSHYPIGFGTCNNPWYHNHYGYLSTGSLTYTPADSNKFLQLTSSGTFTLASGSGTVWGTITGTLSDQSDLNLALGGKSDNGHGHINITDSINFAYDSLSSHSQTFTLIFDTLSAHRTRFDTKLDTSIQTTLNQTIADSTHSREPLFGLPDTTGFVDSVLAVKAGGGFAWKEDKQGTGGTIPAGVIVMWSGSVATIPSGWALCDGTLGTPDLRDKFVLGAGGNYAVDATGGSNSYTLNYATSGTTTLVSAGIPSGTVNVVVDNHAAHHHTADGTLAAAATATAGLKPGTSASTTAAQTHTHDITGNTSNETAALTHNVSSQTFTGSAMSVHSHAVTGTQSIPTLPLYYALCYIMKL